MWLAYERMRYMFVSPYSLSDCAVVSNVKVE